MIGDESKFWKTSAFPQTPQESPRLLNHNILQSVMLFRSMSTQHKRETVDICFHFKVITHYSEQSFRKSKAHNPSNAQS